MKTISGYGALGEETANRMIENVVGTFPLPLGFAPNFKINDWTDQLVADKKQLYISSFGKGNDGYLYVIL